MNREMRRLQAKEEERAKKRRQQGPKQKARRPGEERPSLWARLRQFTREVRQELKKVAWPTRGETTTFSVVVLIVTVVLTAITFGLDFGFKQAVLAIL